MTGASEEARRREAARLDGEILEAIGRGWEPPLAGFEFDRLARDVFAHQHRFNPVYRQFCLLQGVSAPADVTDWRAIPPVPAGAFKVGRWATFPPEEEAVAFRTSGTTTSGRGVHSLDTLSLANAAIVPNARRFLVPDRERIRCLLLSPPPRAAPDSSLVHMFAVFREAFGAPGSGFFLTGTPAAGGLATDALVTALDRACDDGEPILVAGAALAFVHALAAVEPAAWVLPPGSRTMVTGGFKGVRGETDPGRLRESIARRLGVTTPFQAEEYGMTELSSQYYEGRLRERLTGGADPGPGFVVPPWVRVRVVEPATGVEAPQGESGALVHFDLANRGTALAIQTSDVGVRTGERSFVLLGREPGAEIRGCSLAADLWLGGT